MILGSCQLPTEISSHRRQTMHPYSSSRVPKWRPRNMMFRTYIGPSRQPQLPRPSWPGFSIQVNSRHRVTLPQTRSPQDKSRRSMARISLIFPVLHQTRRTCPHIRGNMVLLANAGHLQAPRGLECGGAFCVHSECCDGTFSQHFCAAEDAPW
ncbi:hypothetical protein BC827DRAFT_1248543 [Russula dissimulans]|nr:hypothetical protein BC827DRAFT_1248543 [Russula dissimulans]